MSEPAKPALAPAGIVKVKGVDDVLDRVYEALDAQEFRNEFLEGRPITEGEVRRRSELLTTITREVNIRLNGRVRVRCSAPEVMGRGARFLGTDSEDRLYTVDFFYGAEDRMAHAPDDRESEVREVVGMIVENILAKRAEYLAHAGIA